MATQATMVITGNVGKDPYINESGERPFATFSVGHTPYSRDESKKKTVWVKVMVNGPQVQVVKDYVRKGNFVTVTGKITKNDIARDQTGKMVTSASGDPIIELMLQSHELTLGPKSSNDNASKTSTASASSSVVAEDDSAPF